MMTVVRNPAYGFIEESAARYFNEIQEAATAFYALQALEKSPLRDELEVRQLAAFTSLARRLIAKDPNEEGYPDILEELITILPQRFRKEAKERAKKSLEETK